MMRVGLALYLMFAVAAGPSFCCCSGVRLLGRLCDAKHAEMAVSSCCNHRVTGGGRENQQPEKPSPQTPCPCRAGGPEPIAISGATSSLKVYFGRPIALSHEFALGVFGATEFVAWHPPAENAGFACSSPFQNPRDMLSVLQTLRC